jgi:hypothetical protein
MGSSTRFNGFSRIAWGFNPRWMSAQSKNPISRFRDGWGLSQPIAIIFCYLVPQPILTDHRGRLNATEFSIQRNQGSFRVALQVDPKFDLKFDPKSGLKFGPKFGPKFGLKASGLAPIAPRSKPQPKQPNFRPRKSRYHKGLSPIGGSLPTRVSLW